MFNGFKILYDYVYLYLDNNYEFASDINSKEKKQSKIIEECNNYLREHNIKSRDKVFFISKGIVIGYIDKNKINDIK